MELKRNFEAQKIYLVEDEKVLLETGYIGAEFFISLSTEKPLVITKELDEYLYANLEQILANEYVFDSHCLSYKNANKIVWFSDQYCDPEDENQTNMINRLILEKMNGIIKINFENPFLKKYNIKRNGNIIAFSVCGNGFYSKNVNTGLTFQDDIVIAFSNTLKCKYKEAGIVRNLVK